MPQSGHGRLAAGVMDDVATRYLIDAHRNKAGVITQEVKGRSRVRSFAVGRLTTNVLLKAWRAVPNLRSVDRVGSACFCTQWTLIIGITRRWCPERGARLVEPAGSSCPPVVLFHALWVKIDGRGLIIAGMRSSRS